jgi:hypothetical protein
MTVPEPALSILIPTLASRRPLFEMLRAKLAAQIARAGGERIVEIVIAEDDGRMTVGAKRNLLLARARGRHIASVDDDDDVHDDYVSLILRPLRNSPDVDCLGIAGDMIFPTGETRRFIYSLSHRFYRTVGGLMLRPPHHLNPIRRSIALAFPYEDVRVHEDSDVALRMARQGALASEIMIEEPLYRYRSRRRFQTHLLLERTEWVRHPLMLQRVNLVRLKRALRTTRTALLKGG